MLKLAVYSYILIAFLKHEVQIGEVAASVAYIVLCVRDVMEIVGSWQQLKIIMRTWSGIFLSGAG